jgi:hypothetical protein
VVKVVFGWKDNPALTAQECEAHYRAHHMPMAREAFTGADGFRLLGHPVLRRMFDDHPHFMATDTPANIKIYEVEEEVVLEAPPVVPAPVAGGRAGG